MKAVKRLYLGEPIPPTSFVSGQRDAAIDAVNDFELMQAVGGYLHLQAIPQAERHRFLLVMHGKQQAEEEQLRKARAETGERGSGSGADAPTPSVGAGGGWRQINTGRRPGGQGADD